MIRFLLFFAFCSCSSAISYCTSYFIPEPSPEVTVTIKTVEKTNGGAPVYLLIKATDFSHFLMDDYESIEASMAYPEEDWAPLALICLFPGTSETVQILPEEKKGIGFYALFTHPGANWKQILNTQSPFNEIELQLGEDEIESVTTK